MMARKSTLNLWSALTAGGTLLCGVTLWTASRSQSIDKPDTPLKVAIVLDCIAQPRFQDDMKNFGMSRMLPTAGGHLVSGQMTLPTQKDRDLFKSAEMSHRDFLVGFIHCAHVPGTPPLRSIGPGSRRARPVAATGKPGPGGPPPSPDLSDSAVRVSSVCNRLRHVYATHDAAGTKAAQAEEARLYQEMQQAANTAMPKLMKGQGSEQEAGDWLIVTRPVRALKESCLKCHEGAKLGDTLGAMAYVVSKKTFADATPMSGGRPNGPRGGF